MVSGPANVKNLVILRDQLKTAWNSGRNPELKKVGDLLSKAKESLINSKFLPGSTSESSKDELHTARDILEIGAFWSIVKQDIPSFERYMAQLKCYYLDFKDVIPESPFKCELLGLNLICLLSQNRVAEFHTELELVAHPDVRILENVYIKHAIAVEQWLMEGRYNKIFQAKRHVPAEAYNFFIDILLDSVRDQIAVCIEKSYRSLKPEDAAKSLNITLPQLQEIAKKRGWIVSSNGFFVFRSEKTEDEEIPSFELAKDFIEYAKELEQII